MDKVTEEKQTLKALNDIERAKWAKQIQDNPLVKEYFDDVCSTLFDRLKKTKPGEPEKREQIYVELRELERFNENFTLCIKKGIDGENFLDSLANKVRNIMQMKR